MWWYLFLILPVLIIIVLFLPVYFSVEMKGDSADTKVRIGFLDITKLIFKDDKPKKQKASANKPKTAEKKKKPITERIEEFKDKIKLLFDIVKILSKRITVTRFNVQCRIGTGDAADTAVLYGAVCAAFSAVEAFVNESFRVKKQNIYIYPEFTEKGSDVKAYIRIRIFVFSAIGAAFKIIFRVSQNERKA